MSRPQLSRQQMISQLAGRKLGLAPGGSGLHVPREKGLLGVLVSVNRDHRGPCPEPTAYPEASLSVTYKEGDSRAPHSVPKPGLPGVSPVMAERTWHIASAG